MTFATAFFAPFLLLLPPNEEPEAERFSVPEEVHQTAHSRGLPAGLAPNRARQPETALPWPFRLMANSVRPGAVEQVRIERRMTVRVAPFPAPVRPDPLMKLPGRELSPVFIERRMGKCVTVAEITGVQAERSNQLILFMRDHRIVRADLERSCRARDFYSGFYLARTPDGQLCVDRDTLQSRSGSNCKLTRMRRLIAVED